MAHVVGVPKRDPCAKCSLPVFLAERMIVGSNTYHRACMKCARCSSQLTLGSFYETELDGQYCCETCPDEEETHNQSKRSSIADKLAFFESAPANEKVLSKSMSDEQKSKSLKAAMPPKYKPNTSFNNYINKTVMDLDQTDNNIPELPSSSPPPFEIDPASSIVVESNTTSPTANDALKSISSEETKDNDSMKMRSNKEDSPEKVASSSPTLDLETRNRLSLVRARLNQFEEIESSFKKEEQKAIPNSYTYVVPEQTKSENNEDLSAVAQENSVSQEILKTNDDPTNSEDEDVVIVPINLDQDDQLTFEEIASQPTCKENNSYENSAPVPSLNVDEEIQPSENDDPCDDDSQLAENSVPITEIVSQSDSHALNDSPVQNVPLEEVLSTKKIEIPDIIIENNDEIVKQDPVNDSLDKIIEIEEVPLEESHQKDESYPDHLNPFQSDDDGEEEGETKNATPSANDSVNPFDSDDDEVELDKVKPKPPRPPPPKISKNPFGSESEEEECAMNLSSAKRTPIPKPRT